MDPRSGLDEYCRRDQVGSTSRSFHPESFEIESLSVQAKPSVCDAG